MIWLRRIDLHDVIGLAGFLAVEYGVAQWSRPSAIVLAGLCGVGIFLWPLRKGN